jgi:hypothetical protein
MNNDNSKLKNTPSSWSRSLAGSPSECGTPIEQTVAQQKTTEELYDPWLLLHGGSPNSFGRF